MQGRHDGSDMNDTTGHRLGLGADELLSTTRAVRKRLDLERPVEMQLVDECLELAAQAPTGSNAQGWHFLVVTDPDKRARLGEMYRQGFEMFYGDRAAAEAGLPADDPDYVATTKRVIDSAEYLAQHMGEVPVMVIPCIEGRTDGGNVVIQASVWGSLLPAVWSFMLAARDRGLGTCWTTLHLLAEAEAAELLGIPDTVMQGALIPVAHTIGTDFKPGARRDMSRIVHHDSW
jgi:nitroreductase